MIYRRGNLNACQFANGTLGKDGGRRESTLDAAETKLDLLA